MSSIAEQISSSRGLLKALEAITNCRAFLTVLGTLVLGFVTAIMVGLLASQLGGGVGSSAFGLLGLLIVAVIFITGCSAAGFIVNDQMRSREQRSIGDAVMAALLTLPRLIGVILLIKVIGLLIALVMVVALFFCKIPFVGPMLYGFVFPLSVLAFGAACYAGLFVVALAAPAIWEGNGVVRTLGILWAIIRKRLLLVVVHGLLLALLVGAVASLVMGGLMMGMVFTAGLSAFVLQVGSAGAMVGGLSARALAGYGGSGYLIAGAIGIGVVMACAAVVPALVAMAGNCIIFANASDDLPAEEYESRIAGAVDSVKQKANAARQQLEEKRQKTQVVAADVPPAAPSCPHCKRAISVEDAFCGHCGGKLK